ncbi:uncharacterized protein LOC117169469 isoform X1 [Belonocnema kinseyi]|uniref:uncharacterized protein LOC117169469 isoform X1 n=1 Tax=Belonocnema kinseyi TaxID=2817044 RepID=UPI00143D90C0|nr:uncharacterized protein LOC117169469 isoform X1 [Belonocnema kinseyi]
MKYSASLLLFVLYLIKCEALVRPEPVSLVFERQFGSDTYNLRTKCHIKKANTASSAARDLYKESLKVDKLIKDKATEQTTSSELKHLTEKYCTKNEKLAPLAQKLVDAVQDCLKNSMDNAKKQKIMAIFTNTICESIFSEPVISTLFLILNLSTLFFVSFESKNQVNEIKNFAAVLFLCFLLFMGAFSNESITFIFERQFGSDPDNLNTKCNNDKAEAVSRAKNELIQANRKIENIIKEKITNDTTWDEISHLTRQHCDGNETIHFLSKKLVDDAQECLQNSLDDKKRAEIIREFVSNSCASIYNKFNSQG